MSGSTRGIPGAVKDWGEERWYDVRSAYLTAWMVALAIYAILPLPMWWLNVTAEGSGWMYLNAIPTVLGTIAIFFWGLRPTNLVAFGGIGGLMELLRDKDTSQGVAIGPYWLYRAVLWFGFGFFMISMSLTTWSMHEAPGAFWIGYLTVLGLVLVFQLLKWKGTWAPYIALLYLLVCLAVSAWQTLGVKDVAHQELFENGYANDMGYYVDGNYVSLGKKPADCVPGGQPAFKPDGEMFSFRKNNEAWVKRHNLEWGDKSRGHWRHDEDGDGVYEREIWRPICWEGPIPLVPPLPEDRPELGRFGWHTIVDAFTETPAEKAERKAREAAAKNKPKGGAAKVAPPAAKANKSAPTGKPTATKKLGPARTILNNGDIVDLTRTVRKDNNALLYTVQGTVEFRVPGGGWCTRPDTIGLDVQPSADGRKVVVKPIPGLSEGTLDLEILNKATGCP